MLLVVLVGFVLLVLGLATTAGAFARDGRQQAAADAAAAAAARVVAARANAVAALDTGAAETMADLAVVAGACPGLAAARAVPYPGPALTYAIARSSGVCAQAGSLTAAFTQALVDISTTSSALVAALPEDALAAAEAAAAGRGAWAEVGLAPAAPLAFDTHGPEVLCARAEDELDERLRDSVFYAARWEPGGGTAWSAFRGAARAALAARCASGPPVRVPAAGRASLVAWVRGTGRAPGWAGEVPEGEVADTAAAGARAARTGEGGAHDQTWFPGLVPLASVDGAARAEAPPLPWSDLHH